MKRHSLCVLVASTLVASVPAQACAVTIDMVTVGNPDNAPDTRFEPAGVGAVGYAYQIGKYEVTAGQYTEFLNAVAKADPNGLYNALMGSPVNPNFSTPNIQRTGSSPNYSYSVAPDWTNRPVNFVSFWDSVRFVNWLHNGQPTGAQGPGTTEGGAYHDVGDFELFGRKAGATFFIPTENEWYKAAYHDKTAGLAGSYFDYPTGTNAEPGNDITESTNPGNNANFTGFNGSAIGSPYWRTIVGEFELSDSPYGTFDQGGNIDEWNETKLIETEFISGIGVRGGNFIGTGNGPLDLHASRRPLYDWTAELDYIGFRVVSVVPEPSSLLLAALAGSGLLWRRRG